MTRMESTQRKMMHTYLITVTDDVRKLESEKKITTMKVKAESPTEAMLKILKNSKPYTGVYY